jgi:hypothetical protein
MITEHRHHQTLAAFRAGAALRFGTPLLTRSRLTAIHGRHGVEAVEVTHLDTGETHELPCDLVVFTDDWIPDHELAVLAGASLDPGTRGPSVDPALHTTRPGLFAAGNLLHGAETADVAALSGRHVAVGVLRYLEGRPWPGVRVPIRCQAPLHWIAPNAVADPSPTAVPGRGFLLRAHERLTTPLVELVQDGRTLWRGRLPRLMPGRSARLPTTWTLGVDVGGGPVEVRVVAARRQRPRRTRGGNGSGAGARGRGVAGTG